MSVLNNSLLLGQEGGAGYVVERSLRFSSNDSAFLSRTPSSTGNRKTWTWAGWVKRSAIATQEGLFSAGTSTTNDASFGFGAGIIECFNRESSTINMRLQTTPVFRDFSAWYHIVFVWNTTSATASDRVQIWVNGVRITAFNLATYPGQNTDSIINNNVVTYIGTQTLVNYSNSYLADIHFIDGQALTPTSFGEFDVNNVWQPKAYTGSYGTNGFQLKFADNSSNTATTLGKDTSGNGNNFTPNNLSVVAGLTGPAAPILNTNASGTAVTSGVRADASASSLVLALAGATASGLNLTDQIPSGRTQAAQTITNNGVTRTTSTSKFYGGSVDCANGQDIQVSYNSSMALGGTFTIEFWANPSAAGNEKTIATFGINATDGYVLMLGTGGARFRSNGASDLVYTATISGWNHLAYVASSGGTRRIFVNGVLVASDSGTINATGSYVTYIGSSSVNNVSFRFVGQFQDFRIYKGLAKYTANFTPVSPSPGDIDSLVDTPTSYGTDDGLGGSVRGNYCTLSPIDKAANIIPANGNLAASDGANVLIRGTIFVSSGKWYYECTASTLSGAFVIGVATNQASLSYLGVDANGWGYTGAGGGLKYNAGGSAFYGSGIATGDVIGVAIDMDAKTLVFYKNGSSLGTAYSNLTGAVAPAYSGGAGSTCDFNFGQRPFAYTAPSGFKALCTANLPEGSITTSGSFTGNANADGPFIWLNGVPTAMTINGNSVTFGTHADKLSNGFKLRTNSTSYNTSGSNTYSITTTGAKFKNARAQANP